MSENSRHSRGGERQRGQGQRDHRGRERSGSRGRGAPRKGFSENRPSERRRETSPSRLAVYEALRAVDEDGSYANLVLSPTLRRHRVSGRDAAFATELFYGTLRAIGRLDPIIGRCCSRPLDEVDPKVRDVLRLGAYQLLEMSVAPHAATSETVGLARMVTGAGSAQFVNAVLRAVGAKELDEWLAEVLPDRQAQPVEYLAMKYSHPAWIVRALGDALVAHGRSRDELEALLAAQNAAPTVDLVMRPGLCDLAELEEYGAAQGRLSPFAAHWPGGDPGGITPVRQGRAGVQDEGSQLAALTLAQGADDAVQADDAHWLDLCAGPGGKSALLAGLTVEHDADLLATELQPHRADLVREAVASLVEAGCDVVVEAADGREVGSRMPGRFSRVLADVPCTGLGALRRRPEARWRKSPGDISTLSGLQRELLISALDAAAPGGVVAYVTCSPHVAETLLVVKDVLRKRKDVSRLDTAAALRSCLADGVEIDLPDTDSVQLWPHIHGTDAMFICLLRKDA
ncbi:RsmB/NOP family class I SAM-dependent RNA methyltransferase [Dermabacteraceae bacterium P13103]